MTGSEKFAWCVGLFLCFICIFLKSPFVVTFLLFTALIVGGALLAGGGGDGRNGRR